jgi:hypothetical protein
MLDTEIAQQRSRVLEAEAETLDGNPERAGATLRRWQDIDEDEASLR